jgi:hypothetical protein
MAEIQEHYNKNLEMTNKLAPNLDALFSLKLTHSSRYPH